MENKIYEYSSTRLSFRKNIIDNMKENDCLIINVRGAVDRNNDGVFKLTKKQIFENFENVIKSKAYKDGGYNYQTTPQKAQRYRIR